MSPKSGSELETSNFTNSLPATRLQNLYYHFPQESLLHAEGPSPHCSFLFQSPFQDFKEPCYPLTASSSFSVFGAGLEAKEPQLHTVFRRQKFYALILAHKAINASSSCPNNSNIWDTHWISPEHWDGISLTTQFLIQETAQGTSSSFPLIPNSPYTKWCITLLIYTVSLYFTAHSSGSLGSYKSFPSPSIIQSYSGQQWTTSIQFLPNNLCICWLPWVPEQMHLLFR